MKPTQSPSLKNILLYDISSQRFGIFSLIIGTPSLGLVVLGVMNNIITLTAIGIFVLLFAIWFAAHLFTRYRQFHKIYANGETVRYIVKDISKLGDEISVYGFYLFQNESYSYSSTIQKNKRTNKLKVNDQIYLVVDRNVPAHAYIQDLYTPDSPEEIRQPVDPALKSELKGLINSSFSIRKKAREVGQEKLNVMGAILIIAWFLTIGELYLGYGQLDEEVNRIAGAESHPQLVATGKEGTDLLLTGILGGETPNGEEKLYEEAQWMGLIIYAVQAWIAVREDRGWGGEKATGDWYTDHVVLPAEITLDDIKIAIQPADYVYLENEQVTSDVVITGSGEEYGQIRVGSIRLVGYRSGAQVTLLGKRGTTAVLVVERIYGKDRDAILKDSLNNTERTRITGWVFLMLIVGLSGVYLWFRKRWNTHAR